MRKKSWVFILLVSATVIVSFGLWLFSFKRESNAEKIKETWERRIESRNDSLQKDSVK